MVHNNLFEILCENRTMFKILEPTNNAAKELKDGEVYEHMNYVLNTPFMQVVLLVGQAAKNLALLGGGDSITFSQPAFFLTNYEPFPLQGLKLINHTGELEEYPNLWYVGLNTSDHSIEACGVEGIISHEYGHVIMFNLINQKTIEGLDSFAITNIHHLTTAITDYTVAFMEGWANHFEAMACDFTETPRLKRWALNQYKQGISAFWLCERESRLRQWGIRENIFIHETCSDPDLEFLSPDETLKYHMTNSAFNLHSLKSPEDMLSSEGVVGSFFYRLVNDEMIQNTKVSNITYKQFLPLSTHTKLSEFINTINPLTNAYLKIISAFYQMNSSKKIEPPIIMFLKAYANLFPAEKEQIYSIFLENTCYTTVSSEAAELYQKISLAGGFGQTEELKKLWTKWDELSKTVLSQVLKSDDPAPILKESEWVEIPSIKVNKALWLKGEYPLSLNKISGLYNKLAKKI